MRHGCSVAPAAAAPSCISSSAPSPPGHQQRDPRPRPFSELVSPLVGQREAQQSGASGARSPSLSRCAALGTHQHHHGSECGAGHAALVRPEAAASVQPRKQPLLCAFAPAHAPQLLRRLWSGWKTHAVHPEADLGERRGCARVSTAAQLMPGHRELQCCGATRLVVYLHVELRSVILPLPKLLFHIAEGCKHNQRSGRVTWQRGSPRRRIQSAP